MNQHTLTIFYPNIRPNGNAVHFLAAHFSSKSVDHIEYTGWWWWISMEDGRTYLHHTLVERLKPDPRPIARFRGWICRLVILSELFIHQCIAVPSRTDLSGGQPALRISALYNPSNRATKRPILIRSPSLSPWNPGFERIWLDPRDLQEKSPQRLNPTFPKHPGCSVR